MRLLKHINNRFLLVVILFILTSLYPIVSLAQPIDKIAVLPIQDLTHGANGVNFNCTKLLEKDLSIHGIKVISDKKIMSFLVRHRIRWTGFLDTYDTILLGKELNTHYILLGTLCQYDNKIEARVGLTLTLLNTDTGSSIWGWVGSLSVKDFIHPLGLFEPKTAKDLLPLLINRAIEQFPNKVEFTKSVCPNCIIKNIIIRPKYVKSKQPVTCIVRVNKIYPKVSPNMQLYLNNHYIKLNSVAPNKYKIKFLAPSLQGTFPMYLVYQINKKLNKKLYIGNLCVDNKAPKIKLVSRGIHIWNAIALKKRLVILPRLEHPEPISRWQIAVCTLDGEKILSQEGQGPLPSKFFWIGQDASGAMVATGVYKIVLNIWDMAGNKAQASLKVAVIRTPPKIKVSSKIVNNKLLLTLKNETDIPLSFWRLEVFKGENLLKTQIGSKLPVTINLKNFNISKKKFTKIYCIITARDILGNITKKKFINTFTFKKSKKKKQEVNNNAWTTEF